MNLANFNNLDIYFCKNDLQSIFISSTMIQSKPLSTTQQKTQQFFKTVQAGDIALFNLFEEVIAVFGFTKVGKTSSCHMMCGSPLRGESLRGQFIFKSSGTRFMTAKIGNTTDSETQIPNIFEATIKEPGVVPAKTKKIIVLDQPGYGDTYGFHRIYSNGYFIYRTFSKAPKMKFVLAFKKDDLTGTGEYFKKTINNFINTFKDWEANKDDILKATSFLITKADVGTKLQNLKSIVTNLRGATSNMGAKQTQRYQGMIDTVLAAERLFFIEKPKDQFSSKVEDKILQQIYQRSTFWERPVLQNRNVVDMSPINFSVAKEITAKLRDPDNELFREEFDDFMIHISKRIKNVITEDKASLANIINTLKNDAIESSESRQFLTDMGQLVSKFYQFNEDYRVKREETQISLFKSQEGGRWANNNQDLQKEMRGLYFIKKFKVLEYLEQINKELDNYHTERTIEELQEFSNLFIAIFRKFSILRVSANDNDKTIYKYSYIIQRIIEESKILTLILFSNEEIKQDMEQLKVQLPADVFFVIKDEIITLVIGEIKVDSLKEQFIGKLNFEDLKLINQEIIQFFESITNKEEEVQLRIAKLIVEFSFGLVKSDKIPSEQDIIFAGQKLFTYRNKFYAHLQNLENNGGSQSSKEKTIEIIVQLTNMLAKILQQHLNKFDEARECYQSVNNAQSVFQIFEKQLISESASPQKQRKLNIQYAKMAGYFNRTELALKCCQKAYALSASYFEMKEASTMIVNLMTEKKDEKDDPYLGKFLNENFCEDFSLDLKEQLEIALNLQSF